MNVKVEHAGLSDRGRVRKKNEDNWMADSEHGIYIVSDGLGGEFAGDVASKIVVETLPTLLRQKLTGIQHLTDPKAKPQLLQAIVDLSNKVRQETKGEPGLEGMGATVVLALVRGSKALIGHLGDSRAYLIRDGHLKQLTKDHSIVQLLIDNGEIKPEQAATHHARGRVTQSVGMSGEPLPEAKLVKLEAGDLLLLCSDGLVGMLTDKEIETMVRRQDKPAVICGHLIDAANKAGGRDNITALILAIGQPNGGTETIANRRTS
ncbi:MAG: serine/threonine-protein phosphatase [Verrucomicrobiae bacterium]|nr:serine/threonine-protein phosphatase [Verrucomicrobiae bacterium]